VRDDLGDPTRRFWEVGDALAHLRFDATPPSIPDAVLRTLDPLEREIAGRPLTDVLADTYDSLTSGARTRLTS
jgi:hypothetical protein